MSNWKIVQGDSTEVSAQIMENSVDAIVTDPPYGLAFMNKEWDHGVPSVEAWKAHLRVAKPGAYLVAFGGTRTHHRLMCAIEDAGWEIRNCLMWLYGSGFPKSHNISKAIDKALEAEREVVGYKKGKGGENLNVLSRPQGGDSSEGRSLGSYGVGAKQTTVEIPVTVAKTDQAKLAEGYGTATKPAYEPIILARKPLAEKTVAKQFMSNGCGGLNIDACRIGDTKDVPTSVSRSKGASLAGSVDGSLRKETGLESGHNPNIGRWPPNLLLSHSADCTEDECMEDCPVRIIGEQSGNRKGGGSLSGLEPSGRTSTVYGEHKRSSFSSHNDNGTAARFFPNFRYCPKAPKKERMAGLPEGTKLHPTVKPLALMRWLIRLVTPPIADPIIYDPYCGSGSTGVAALLEGYQFVGVDLSYTETAEARLEHTSKELADEVS